MKPVTATPASHGARGPGLAGVLAAIVGIPLLFAGVLGAYPSPVLWADDFDSMLLLWILEWGAHAIRTGESFWDANSFFPHEHSLAYSDSLLGAQLFYTPLRLAGIGPVYSAYLTFAGFCLIGAVLSDVALCRLGIFRFSERLLVIYAAHFGLNVVNFFYHYQLFGFELAPPFLLFLYLFVTRFNRWDLLACVSTGAFAVTVATYLVPMLGALVAVVALPIAALQLLQVSPRAVIRQQGGGVPLAVVCILAVLWYAQLRPYQQFRNVVEHQNYEETRTYSANLKSLVEPAVRSSKWYPDTEIANGDWERGIFPGYLLLSCVGLFFAVPVMFSWIRPVRQALFEEPWLPVYAGGIFLVSVGLALGPIDDHGRWLPFAYLAKGIPGLESIRAPGRFGILLGLPLGLMAAYLLRALWGRCRPLVAVAAFVAVSVESVVNHPVFPFPPEQPAVSQRVAEVVHSGEPLIVLPVASGDHIKTLKRVMQQLFESRHHWARLIVGYGARTTPEMGRLLHLDNGLNTSGDLGEIVQFGRSLGIRHLLIDTSQYPELVQDTLKSSIEQIVKDGAVSRFTEGPVILLDLLMHDNPL